MFSHIFVFLNVIQRIALSDQLTNDYMHLQETIMGKLVVVLHNTISFISLITMQLGFNIPVIR